MSYALRIITLFAGILVVGCADISRTAFMPQSGPPTVGMPASLSERERLFMPEIESALRDAGLMPVRHGSGDMELEFSMAAGPINTDTRIILSDERRTIASGTGRASGVPLVGRSTVAENSFNRAFETFHAELAEARVRRGWKQPATRSAETTDLPLY